MPQAVAPYQNIRLRVDVRMKLHLFTRKSKVQKFVTITDNLTNAWALFIITISSVNMAY